MDQKQASSWTKNAFTLLFPVILRNNRTSQNVRFLVIYVHWSICYIYVYCCYRDWYLTVLHHEWLNTHVTCDLSVRTEAHCIATMNPNIQWQRVMLIRLSWNAYIRSSQKDRKQQTTNNTIKAIKYTVDA